MTISTHVLIKQSNESNYLLLLPLYFHYILQSSISTSISNNIDIYIFPIYIFADSIEFESFACISSWGSCFSKFSNYSTYCTNCIHNNKKQRVNRKLKTENENLYSTLNSIDLVFEFYKILYWFHRKKGFRYQQKKWNFHLYVKHDCN